MLIILQVSAQSLDEIIRATYTIHFVTLLRHRPIVNHIAHTSILIQSSVIKEFLSAGDENDAQQQRSYAWKGGESS